MDGCPGVWSDVLNLPVGHVRQASQDITEVGVGINSVTLTGGYQGVKDSAVLAGFRVPEKQPVLFTDRRWPDGIFHQVVVDLQLRFIEIATES